MKRLALLATLAGCAPDAPAPAEAPKSAASSTSAAPAPASDPAPPSAPETAAPPEAPAELRRAWRESVQYRAGFKALVENVPGLEADRARLKRLASETRMFEVMPVAPRPAEDAAAVRSALEFHAERLGLKGVKVDLSTLLPVRPPPPKVRHTDGIHYTPEQLVGRHQLTISFARRADAEAWIRGLRQLPRVPLIEKIRTREGRTVAEGYAPYFRDLAPAEVLRPEPQVDMIIEHAGGADTPTAEKLRANYAEVAALDARIEAAFRLEAELKLLTSRFSQFTAHAKALEQMSWLALTGKGGPKPAGHGH